MFCFPQTRCNFHSEKYFQEKSKLWGKSCLVLGWIEKKSLCIANEGVVTSRMEISDLDSGFMRRSPGSLFLGIRVQPCCLTEWKEGKYRRDLLQQKICLSAKCSPKLVGDCSYFWRFPWTCECLWWQLRGSCSELGVAVALQAGCRHSCLPVRHPESNVPSIFQQDKWRRHDPNVKWPGRKASASSTDRTLQINSESSSEVMTLTSVALSRSAFPPEHLN